VNLRLTADAVANRNSARRGRSRKRRPTASGSSQRSAGTQRGAGAGPVGERAPAPPATPGKPARAQRRAASASAASADERPRAPWHPLPLSELLILIGLIATVIGLRRANSGFSAAAPTLAVGLGAVLIGTLEVTVREHRSGFRSHAMLLAALPVVVLHTAIAVVVSTTAHVPWLALNVGLLVADVAAFALLFKLLRARFADARRERRFAGGR